MTLLQIVVLCIVIVVSIISVIIFISNLFFIPLSFFDKTRIEFGKITEIDYEDKYFNKLSLTTVAEMEKDIRKKQDFTLVSASTSSFLHFRKDQQQPKLEDIIEAETKFYYFSLRGRGVNFVKSWKKISEIPEKNKPIVKKYEIPNTENGFSVTY